MVINEASRTLRIDREHDKVVREKVTRLERALGGLGGQAIAATGRDKRQLGMLGGVEARLSALKKKMRFPPTPSLGGCGDGRRKPSPTEGASSSHGPTPATTSPAPRQTTAPKVPRPQPAVPKPKTWPDRTQTSSRPSTGRSIMRAQPPGSRTFSSPGVGGTVCELQRPHFAQANACPKTAARGDAKGWRSPSSKWR